ncbi:Putative transferase, LIC12162 family [Candidatus Planktophila dulcis]
MARYLLAEKPLIPWDGEETAILVGSWLAPEWTEEDYHQFNVETIPYHWDDRKKLEMDMDYSKSIIEEFLVRITGELNRIHGINKSPKFWRILVGEWLYLLVQISLDRTEMLKTAARLYDAKLLIGENLKVPRAQLSISEFLQDIRNPKWNSEFIALLAKLSEEGQTRLPPVNFADYEKSLNQSTISVSSKPHTILKITKFFACKLNRLTPRIQITKTYLNRIDEFRLALKLRTIPILFQSQSISPTLENLERGSFQLGQEGDDQLETLLSLLIPLLLPVTYFEGFNYCTHEAVREFGATTPKAIVTANDFSGNELWKFWAAHSAEQGSKIVILQHGGLYGINAKSLMQDYEISIADEYLSWGWSEKQLPQVVPAPATKLISRNQRTQSSYSDKECSLLLVTFEMPLMSYWLASMPIGPQVAEAVELNYQIVARLSKELQHELRVKTFPQDFGLKQREKFASQFGNECLSETSLTFGEALKSAKLVLSTYNATTFIESMHMNIPTIMCWDPKLWEVTPEAQRYFDKLVECNVMFYSATECAEFLNASWEFISEWWQSDLVQRAVQDFLKAYGYTGNDPISEISKIIRSASARD